MHNQSDWSLPNNHGTLYVYFLVLHPAKEGGASPQSTAGTADPGAGGQGEAAEAQDPVRNAATQGGGQPAPQAEAEACVGTC